jgi:ABC-type transport system substrate-binding protein
MKHSKLMFVVGLVVLASMLLAACQPVVTTVTVEVTKVVNQVQTQVVNQTSVVESTKIVQVERKPFTTPHPILSDLKVRQAIAYCTNKLDLIKSVYPLLGADDQKKLVMDTFIPKDHWAYAGDANITIYPFQADVGKSVLTDAGWKDNPDTGVRQNAAGDPLSLKFTTTNATFRQTWSAVFEKQMSNCGIQIVRFMVPSTWWFGDSTGLARRDFELGAFAWVGQADPSGQTLYACDQIPGPDNGWTGQNDMGWCNQKASDAIKAANNTLLQKDRIAQYTIVQQEFAKDLPSLPLFNRTNTYAYNPKLTGFEDAPGQDYWIYGIENWAIPGKDTIVLGLTQEPSGLYLLSNAAQVAHTAYYPIGSNTYKGLNYTYTALNYMKDLPSLENGMAVNSDVDVKDGDPIMDAAGNPGTLKAGIQVIDNTGKTVDYKGGGLKMKQLAVTFQMDDGIKWSDGQPLVKEDMQLYIKQYCDKDSGNLSFIVCDQILKTDFASDTKYTITFKPGVQPPTYMTYAWGWYPAHLVITSDGPDKGKKLSDVPAKDWQTLPEMTEHPIDTGPYMLKEWKKGQTMTFVPNPNWYKAKPKTSTIVIKFIDPANAEAQLISGEVDFLGDETLTAKTQTLADAEKAGKVTVLILASATWEHIDFSLFVK